MIQEPASRKKRLHGIDGHAEGDIQREAAGRTEDYVDGKRWPGRQAGTAMGRDAQNRL